MNKIFFIMLIVFFLTGCGEIVSSSVTRFHSPEFLESGKKFAIVPFEKQESNLEFERYASLVSEKLEGFGYQEAGRDHANYGVLFNYGISDGETSVLSSPVYGQIGGGTTHHYGGYGGYIGTSYSQPVFGVVGSSTQSYTTYTRFLNLDIVDLKKSSESDIVKLFEGKVASAGSNSTFLAVSQCLIDALFLDFPGENGVNQIVTAPNDDCLLSK